MLPYLRQRRSGTPWYDRLWTQHATQAAISSRRPHGRHHDGSRHRHLHFRRGWTLRLALPAVLRPHPCRGARRASSASSRTCRTVRSTTGWGRTSNRGADGTDSARASGEPAVSPTAEDFQPTHQIGAGQSVNFRSGPSTTDAIIVALPPETPLQYLNEDAPTENPSDGDRWMRFRNEAGDEGWIREIDTEPYQP